MQSLFMAISSQRLVNMVWSRRVEVFSGRSLIESKSNKSKCQRIAKFKFGLLCLFCPKNSHPIEFFFSISWHFDSSGILFRPVDTNNFDLLTFIFRYPETNFPFVGSYFSFFFRLFDTLFRPFRQFFSSRWYF